MIQGIEKSDQQNILNSLIEVYRLKLLPRSGWLQAGISAVNVESIASHTFGMLTLLLWQRTAIIQAGLDLGKALSMAAIHDIAETRIGDITPLDGMDPLRKHKLESAAFQDLTTDVVGGTALLDLWQEFEAGQTPEAQLVKRLDKLDMLIQAYIYEQEYSIRLDSFWQDMAGLFKDTESESIFRYMLNNRKEI